MRRTVLAAMLCLPVALQAQFSGYASSTISANSNPLYNYEMVTDRLTEGYWELNYEPEETETPWGIGYVGGLMLFNTFAPRNYYEHRGTVQLDWDHTSLSAMIGARHDRAEFKEFDNIGLELGGSYTWGEEGESQVELSDRFGYRGYTYIRELSNLTNTAQLAVTAGERTEISTRYFVSFGVKHFTTDIIDSSAFAAVQSTEGGGSGKGKGSGSSSGSGSGSGSAKKQSVLVASSSANSLQLAAGIAIGKEWRGGGMDAGFTYRLDPGSDTRLLAQVANSSILGEDIYNDHFSYAGPEISVTLRQELPLGLRLNASAEAQFRNYLAPAFDLTGAQTHPDRTDRRGSVQASLSRSFPLSDAVSIDLTLTCSALRNQSNDTYNDFSVRGLGVSLGMGF